MMPTIISLGKKNKKKQNKTVIEITHSCKREIRLYNLLCQTNARDRFRLRARFHELASFSFTTKYNKLFFRPSDSSLARDLGCFNFHSPKTSALNFRQVPVANGTAEICKISKKMDNLAKCAQIF